MKGEKEGLKIGLIGAFMAGMAVLSMCSLGVVLGRYLPYMSLEKQLVNLVSSSVLVFILMFLWYFVYFRIRKIESLGKWKLVTMTALFCCIIAGLSFGLLFILFVLAAMYYTKRYFDRKMGRATFDERSEQVSMLSARKTLEATIALLLALVITKADLNEVWIFGLTGFAPIMLGFIVLSYSVIHWHYSLKLGDPADRAGGELLFSVFAIAVLLVLFIGVLFIVSSLGG